MNKCYRLWFWEWSNLWAPCCLAFSTNLSFLNKREKRRQILLVDVDPPRKNKTIIMARKTKKRLKKKAGNEKDGWIDSTWNRIYLPMALKGLEFLFILPSVRASKMRAPQKKKKRGPLGNIITTGWSVILRRDDWFRVLTRNTNLTTGWGGRWFLLI